MVTTTTITRENGQQIKTTTTVNSDNGYYHTSKYTTSIPITTIAKGKDFLSYNIISGGFLHLGKYVFECDSFIHSKFPQLEIKDATATARDAIIFMNDQIRLIDSNFEAPVIIFKDPESLDNQGSTLNGKVMYLSDSTTCESYGSEEYLTELCQSLQYNDEL